MSHSKNYNSFRNIYRIALKIHAELGQGLCKQCYIDALNLEFLSVTSIHAELNPSIPVFYKGKVLAHSLEPDFRVFGKVLIYVHATAEIAPTLKTALYKRIKASGQTMGVIFNFGGTELECEKVVLYGKCCLGSTPFKGPPLAGV